MAHLLNTRIFDEKAFNYFFVLEGSSYNEAISKITEASQRNGSSLQQIHNIIRDMMNTFINCFDEYDSKTIDSIQTEIKKYNILVESNKNKLDNCRNSDNSNNLSNIIHKLIAVDIFYDAIIKFYNYMILKISTQQTIK